jgi:uracil phosphoribosyltransferase
VNAVPLRLVDHPLAHDALTRLRAVDTNHEQFRQAARRISLLLVAEALRDLPTEALKVHTPLYPPAADGRRVGCDVVVVPVLRAGLGMLDAVLELVPGARVGHIGLQRDEATAVASQYYSKLPTRLDSSYVLMIDPMLATGGSAVAALDLIRHAGANTVRLICIVAAPEGVALVQQHHPDVLIYTPVVDTELNAHKYIVPGLGDFGDRLYGTV